MRHREPAAYDPVVPGVVVGLDRRVVHGSHELRPASGSVVVTSSETVPTQVSTAETATLETRIPSAYSPPEVWRW